MAGDWIKIEHVTPDKPEVVSMADTLGIDQDAVTGKLVRLWIWADQQSLNGHAISVTKTFLNRVTMQTGFAEAMEAVGWLSDDGEISIPNFDRHNGKTAKNRALSNRRKSESRKCPAESVTHLGTREEKRRVKEKIEKEKVDGEGKPDSIEQVKVFATANALPVNPVDDFWDYFTSNGWKVGGRTAMKDWHAAYRGWCRRSNSPKGKPQQSTLELPKL